VKCIVCDNDQEFRKLSPELCSTNNWLCSQCGIVFIPREQGKNNEYYKEGGYYTNSPNLAGRRLLTSKHLLLQSAKDRVEIIDKLLPGALKDKSVLDVGCGYGEILGYLKARRNCRVVGMEPSPDTGNAGKEFFGIDIIPALFGDWDFRGEQFDVVICNHTLEHVDDPKRFLNLLKERVKPGGMLYLEVPNIMWPSGGFTLDAFLYHEHLQTFSVRNLAMLLKKCGFTVRAFSDKQFLRFVCAADGASGGLELPSLSAEEIETFLRRYRETYSIAQHARVYAGKFRYLARLVYSKMVDLVA